MGGSQNALSVARNLSRHAIEVIAVNYPHEAIRFSRHAHYIKLGGKGSPMAWEEFLLGQDSNYLAGAVLFPCSDEAISIILKNYAILARKFRVEETDPVIRCELLDKFAMYRRAQEAGIPTVGYRLLSSVEDLDEASTKLRFPLMMKPLYSPEARILKCKAVLVGDRFALASKFKIASELGVGVLVMEYVPGGDDQLCSYFTYLDEHGDPLVHLTKRVKRRYPEHGDGTYHLTEWIPEAAALGLRFFRHLKFRGIGNIEFKWDERDGMFKFIEANARFAASDCLIAKSGVNLALIAYNRITGRTQRTTLEYRKSLVLCRPIEDALAAWGLYKEGKLRFSHWISEVRQTNLFPFFEWRDPLPAVAVLGRRAWRLGRGFAPTIKTLRRRSALER
jgi:D-aspartate ligase